MGKRKGALMGEMASVNPLEAQRKKDKAAAFKRAKM